MDYQIITATPDNAFDIVGLIYQLEKESSFMMYEKNEIPSEIDMRQRIARVGENEVFFLAQKGSVSAGYLLLYRGRMVRNHGVGTIALGVLDQFKRQGVGSALLHEAIRWAQSHGVYRLQLQVQTENETAIRLYKKLSFTVEGVLKRASSVNGQYVDKLQMALLL